MLVRDENTHKLKVVLAIGWARDDDLMSFRKCPKQLNWTAHSIQIEKVAHCLSLLLKMQIQNCTQ